MDLCDTKPPMLCFAPLFAYAFREFLKNAYNKLNLREILIRRQQLIFLSLFYQQLQNVYLVSWINRFRFLVYAHGDHAILLVV